MRQTIQSYAGNGVSLSKTSIKSGDEVTLSYDGLLAKSGADKVFAYVGYGEAWENNGFIPMDLTDGVFKTTFKVIGKDSLNITFKDSAENWDNNSSTNYTFKISKTAAKRVTAKPDEEKKKVGRKKAEKKEEKPVEKVSVKRKTVNKKKEE